MLKKRAIIGAAALSILMGALVWTSGDASGVVACTGAIQNQTLGGVSVAPGANCSLRHVTITGNLTATSPNQLLVVESTINGSLTVNGYGTNLTISGVCTTKIGGGVSLQDIPANAANDEDGDGEFTFGSEDADFVGTPVGDFNCQGNDVKGSLRATHNANPLVFETNTFGGSGTITNNTGYVQIDDNTFAGALACSGNSQIYVSDVPNTAGRKTGQCVNL